jgi:flavin-dependent dehydrogenase
LADCARVRDGYAWWIPKKDRDSVGIASFHRDRQKVRPKLMEWVQDCGRRFDEAPIHGHPIPIWRGRARLSSQRTLLVGDAADTVDPLVGEGIRYGIMSGRIAARYIQEALKTGTLSPGYTQAVYEQIQADFVYAKWMALLFYRFPRLCFDLWVRSASGVDLIGEVLYGEIRYRDLFQKAFRALLRPRSYRRLFAC